MLRLGRVARGVLAPSRSLSSAGSARSGQRARAAGSSRSSVTTTAAVAEDLHASELVNDSSREIDSRIVGTLIREDERQRHAEEWFAESMTGHLDENFHAYLEWEQQQVVKWRAGCYGVALGQDEADGAAAESGSEAEEGGGEGAPASDVVDEDAPEPGAEAAGAEDVDDADGAPAEAAADGSAAPDRLVPELPVHYLPNFVGELWRDEMLTPGARQLVAQQTALYAAEGMPWDLTELTHRQKARMYELHTRDPIVFSADRMAAMLQLPVDHVRAALLLQRLQAESEAAQDAAAKDDEAREHLRRRREQLAEMATAYDQQFDTALSLEQVRERLREGAKALRRPALASEEVVQRVYARQRLDHASASSSTLLHPDMSGPLERFIEFEQRAHHFGRTSPEALQSAAAGMLGAEGGGVLREGGASDAPAPLSEPELPPAEPSPAYSASVLSRLRKLDLYDRAEQTTVEEMLALAAEARLDERSEGDDDTPHPPPPEPPAMPGAHDERGAARGASPPSAAPSTHPGLSPTEVAQMLAEEAHRAGVPELATAELATLLFEAQYFDRSVDLRPDERCAPAELHSLIAAESARKAGTRLPEAEAAFTTVLPGRSGGAPQFRFVDDAGEPGSVAALEPRELAALRRRAKRAASPSRGHFDPEYARERMHRNSGRPHVKKRQGEWVVIDSSSGRRPGGRGGRKEPQLPHVHVHVRGKRVDATLADRLQAHAYLGRGSPSKVATARLTR